MTKPASPLPPLDVLAADWPDYALLDSGRRRKLERFGTQIIIRGEPKAWWDPSLPDSAWAAAHAVHEDDRPWRILGGAPREWTMQWRTLTLQARLADTSKHLGIFPEQSPHWEYIQSHGPKTPDGSSQPQTANRIPQTSPPPSSSPLSALRSSLPAQPRLLNLFGYTGVASLAAAAAGFAVTHVDASKPAVAWGRHNQELSGLSAAPIRWILDDALKFLRREIRRGVRYDAIALDPPSYGRGPNGELWKVETQLPELLALCRQCLSETPRFLLLTMYNLEASPLLLANLLEQTTRGLPGTITRGELVLIPTAPEGGTLSRHPSSAAISSTGLKPLPLSLWSRWEGANLQLI